MKKKAIINSATLTKRLTNAELLKKRASISLKIAKRFRFMPSTPAIEAVYVDEEEDVDDPLYIPSQIKLITCNSVSKNSYAESCVKRAKKILLNKQKRVRAMAVKRSVNLITSNFYTDEWLCEKSDILSVIKSPFQTPVKTKGELKQMSVATEYAALIRKSALHCVKFNFKIQLIYFYFIWF